jgi:O-antigen ligase
MVIYGVAARDRARIMKVGAITLVAMTTLIVCLSIASSSLLPVLNAKAASIVFRNPDTPVSSDPAVARVGNPTGNNEWRLRVWRQTIGTSIQKNFVFGEGFGRPAVAGTRDGEILGITDQRVQVHNGYLTYLLREGIVGLLLFLALVAPAFARAIRGARNFEARHHRMFALALCGALCVYLVDIAFGVIVEGPMAGIPFWLLVGLAYLLPDGVRLRPSSAYRI